MLSSKESLKILKETNALIEGHFILSSGLHSSKYVQCAQLMSKPEYATKICESLSQKIKQQYSDFDLILSPAMGGIIVGYELGKLLNRIDISCHCYAGFSPNAIASPPHKDPMEVFFVMIKGTMPWKIFENGCDYNDVNKTMSSKSTLSKRLTPGDFVYVPTGVYHVALPDCSRVGFSFGW